MSVSISRETDSGTSSVSEQLSPDESEHVSAAEEIDSGPASEVSAAESEDDEVATTHEVAATSEQLADDRVHHKAELSPVGGDLMVLSLAEGFVDSAGSQQKFIGTSGPDDYTIAATDDGIQVTNANGDVFTASLAEFSYGFVFELGDGDDIVKVDGLGRDLGSLVIRSGNGDDQVEVVGTEDIPVAMYGGDGDDQFLGGYGNDVAIGGAGDDVLVGGAGHDLLSGGVGVDQLSAGSGTDALYADWTDAIEPGGTPGVSGDLEKDLVFKPQSENAQPLSEDELDALVVYDPRAGQAWLDELNADQERIKVIGSDTFQEMTRVHLGALAASEPGSQLLERVQAGLVENPNVNIRIRETSTSLVASGLFWPIELPGNETRALIDMGIGSGIYEDDTATANPRRVPFTTIGHEMVHLVHYLEGTRLDGQLQNRFSNDVVTEAEERKTVGLSYWSSEDEFWTGLEDPITDNQLREAYGLEPRTTYMGEYGEPVELVSNPDEPEQP